MFDFSVFAHGFVLGLGMFVCPGPKDLLILRQALRRRPIIELLTVGGGSDALLIALGILGISATLRQAPQAQQLALCIGVGLMLWHGVYAVWRCIRGAEEKRFDENARDERMALLLTSFLNPIAWMDTVLVIGTAGAMLPDLSKLSYGIGAVAASAAWFALITFGARSAARWMASESARRVLDALVAVAMIGMAGYVAAGMTANVKSPVNSAPVRACSRSSKVPFNPSIERTRPGKPGRASHVKR